MTDTEEASTVKFVSTRGAAPPVSFATALERGLAPDGGLYVPQSLPRFAPADLAEGEELGSLAVRFLAPFLEGDELAPHLETICAAAFSFPIPLVDVPGPGGRPPVSFLELFHGPTAAFKDVGARFLARCLAACPALPRTILVATSGDTGGAVAAAFHGQEGTEVCLLFPRGGVSPAQQRQLTCWGGNVRAFAVRGTFDDCQAMLKRAFASLGWSGARRLTTANSVNIARLVAQAVYYAWASLAYRERHGHPPTFVVPTGNVGNATAALWAKRMGFPIARVVLATNANRLVPDYLDGAAWEPRPTLSTLANAMDVGCPSNMERVDHLYPTRDALRADVVALSVDDEAIREAIRRGPSRWSRIFDPHTATAVHAVETLSIASPIVVETAHPAKFPEIVEPLIGAPVDVPPALAWIQGRRERYEEVAPDLAALRRALRHATG